LGAEIVFVPSQFPSQRLDHWKTLIRARAIENQIFVVAVNRVGKDSKNSFCGNSMVVDPWGEVLTSKNEKEGVIVTSINLDIIYEVRERLPCLPNTINRIYR
jgi:predicted amidohydrolase